MPVLRVTTQGETVSDVVSAVPQALTQALGSKPMAAPFLRTQLM